MIPTEEQIHEASRGYYGAFDHMLHDWRPVAGFKAGVKWALEQSRWISVEERLPEDKSIVIVYSAKVQASSTSFYSKKYGFETIARVTHWQPLPEAPETK